MKKVIVWGGKVERYYTENNSHQFEVSTWNGKFDCCVNCAGHAVIMRSGKTRIEAIQNALDALQQTDHKLPFATFRMADILTGQF